MKIGEKIRHYRNQKGLTQVELAAKANISRSYLADIEKDRYNPSLDVAKSIAAALGIQVESLFKEDTTSTGEPPTETIAAHHNGNEWTPEELAQIEAFKAFVKSQRKKEEK